MGDDKRLLGFHFIGGEVDIEVDTDKCNLLDLIIEYEDKAREMGIDQPRYGSYAYVWKMKHHDLKNDHDLMTTFERLPRKDMIYIWVGCGPKLSSLNEMVLNLRNTQAKAAESNVGSNAGCVGDNVGENNAEVNPVGVGEKAKVHASKKGVEKQACRPDKLPVRRSLRLKDAVVVEDGDCDRVEEHMKTIVFTGLEDKEVEDDNAYDPAVEWTWNDVVAEHGETSKDPKSLRKFLKEFDKMEKQNKKNQTKSKAAAPQKSKEPKTKPKTIAKAMQILEAEDAAEPTGHNFEMPKSPPKKKIGVNVSFTPRRSLRFTSTVHEVLIVGSNNQNASSNGEAETTRSKNTSESRVYAKKVPRSTAMRKGLLIGCRSRAIVGSNQGSGSHQNVEVNEGGSRSQQTADKEDNGGEGGGSTEESDNSDDDDYKADEKSESDSEFSYVDESFLHADERSADRGVISVEDRWNQGMWHDYVDNDDDDDDYIGRLYRNGELYEERDFGKIELKKWMIFIDKDHFKDTLKDYCVQEGFAITVLWADLSRYTAVCASECCDWRIHASRLVDGRTWAIKKIDPLYHTCRGLETFNPICTVKWAGRKLMEYIRANPDIPGKELNEILFKNYGLYMKQSTLYKMKKDVITQIFGGHDKSYAFLPGYIRMIHSTNQGSKAFCSHNQLGDPQRTLQFSSIYISFAAQIKGFVGGCRSLIGVDGTHLKGNYGGILLSAIGLDANNEIFPIAYAVVSIENEENWSFFFWHLYNQVKDADRDNWTIISDRQKGVDLALKKVWPAAQRRYCCRHLSRNFKKVFPGPLMYILFWRACNASNPYTFKKAMERLRKEGKTAVMKWFADLGKQAKWTKHKFDTSVCCDTNTSNFVESFNSTLGVERCRSVLTLLEGIRRVCMVRIASRQEQAETWDENGICPKIAKMVRDISHSTKFCTAHKSAPGEYEIKEGQSQFPLSLNKKKCACGAWQISGFPCRHAIRAMKAAKLDPHEYVSSWYSVKAYKATYSHNIFPIPDQDQWPEFENLPDLQPPALKRGVGRPPRNRRREEGEDAKGKRAKVVKCTNCGHFGHNIRTCKGGPTAGQLFADEATIIRNKRVRDQTKERKKKAKEAAAAKKQNKTKVKPPPSKKLKPSQEVLTQTRSQPNLSQIEI